MSTSAALGAISARRSLFIDQMIDEAIMRDAWFRVQRGGKAGGVDGMTVDAFRPHAERRLNELRESLARGTYDLARVVGCC